MGVCEQARPPRRKAGGQASWAEDAPGPQQGSFASEALAEDPPRRARSQLRSAAGGSAVVQPHRPDAAWAPGTRPAICPPQRQTRSLQEAHGRGSGGSGPGQRGPLCRRWGILKEWPVHVPTDGQRVQAAGRAGRGPVSWPPKARPGPPHRAQALPAVLRPWSSTPGLALGAETPLWGPSGRASAAGPAPGGEQSHGESPAHFLP